MEHDKRLAEFEFERELAGALRRVDAPEGFAERVMARAGAEATAESPIEPVTPMRAKVLAMPWRPTWWASGTIAAALLAGVFVAQQKHDRDQRQQAEVAQQQFDAAMRITSETLEQTRLQLQQAGVQIGD
jgi:hypothetical protein